MSEAKRILNEMGGYENPNRVKGHEPFCTCVDCHPDHDTRDCKEDDCSLCKGDSRNFKELRKESQRIKRTYD